MFSKFITIICIVVLIIIGIIVTTATDSMVDIGTALVCDRNGCTES